MAKGFYNKDNSPLDVLAGNTDTESYIDEKETQKKDEPKKRDDLEPSKIKRKVGRPPIDPSGKKKKDYTKTINIAVPLDVYEKLDVVKICYGNNLTQYINKLIEKDIEANYDNYKNIANSLNQYK